MHPNRGMPDDVLVPVIAYDDVAAAIAWLTRVFGFTERWRVGDHRAQLAVGPDAAIAVVRGTPGGGDDHVMVRVADVDAHHAHVVAAGAQASPPTTYPFGERQYSVRDHSGRAWVFTQSIADVAPEDWGGTTPG